MGCKILTFGHFLSLFFVFNASVNSRVVYNGLSADEYEKYWWWLVYRRSTILASEGQICFSLIPAAEMYSFSSRSNLFEFMFVNSSLMVRSALLKSAENRPIFRSDKKGNWVAVLHIDKWTVMVILLLISAAGAFFYFL